MRLPPPDAVTGATLAGNNSWKSISVERSSPASSSQSSNVRRTVQNQDADKNRPIDDGSNELKGSSSNNKTKNDAFKCRKDFWWNLGIDHDHQHGRGVSTGDSFVHSDHEHHLYPQSPDATTAPSRNSAVNIVQHWKNRILANKTGGDQKISISPNKTTYSQDRTDDMKTAMTTSTSVENDNTPNRSFGDLTNQDRAQYPESISRTKYACSSTPFPAVDQTSFTDTRRTAEFLKPLSPPKMTLSSSPSSPELWQKKANEKNSSQQVDDEAIRFGTKNQIAAEALSVEKEKTDCVIPTLVIGKTDFEAKEQPVPATLPSMSESSSRFEHYPNKSHTVTYSQPLTTQTESRSMLQTKTAKPSFCLEMKEKGFTTSNPHGSFQQYLKRSQNRQINNEVDYTTVNNDVKTASRSFKESYFDEDVNSDDFRRYTSESPTKISMIHEVSVISDTSSGLALVANASDDSQTSVRSEGFVASDESNDDGILQTIDLVGSETVTTALVILQKDDTYEFLVGEGQKNMFEELVITNSEMIAGDHFAIDEIVLCKCSRSIFSGQDDLISFFLPRIGLTCTCGLSKGANVLINPEDPTAIENVLRPWQVQFLKSFGIQHCEQLVKARHRSGDMLSRALRLWRKKEGMALFKTASCGIALQIWAKTCRAYTRSIREQIRAGKAPLERPPGALIRELSDFFVGLPAAPAKRKRDAVVLLGADTQPDKVVSKGKAAMTNIEPESQVEV